MLHPASERETARWVNDNSSLKEFFDSELNVYDNALHRAAVKLYENKDKIELVLSKSAKNKFDLKETILLYDLTNGNYILRTNRLDLDENQISKIHRSLSVVEDSFKTMKSELS